MNGLIRSLLCIAFAVPMSEHASPHVPPARMQLWAFTGPWDSRSDSSLRVNAPRLDAAVTGWIGLDSTTAQPILPALFPDTIRLRGTHLERMAIVTSWHGDRFHPTSIRTLGQDDRRLARAAGAIAGHAAAMHYSGLVLDFESLERSDLPVLLKVIKTIADSAHARHVSTITVASPAADTTVYPARAIARVADYVMPMLYDQHWSTSGPGPISDPEWVRSTLAARIAEVGASKIVAALPTYGYRWQAKAGVPADPVSFADAQRTVAQAGVALERDARSNTLRAVKAGAWEIWVTDAELLSKLARDASAAGVTRVALWRIGQEDPSIWRALGR